MIKAQLMDQNENSLIIDLEEALNQPEVLCAETLAFFEKYGQHARTCYLSSIVYAWFAEAVHAKMSKEEMLLCTLGKNNLPRFFKGLEFIASESASKST